MSDTPDIIKLTKEEEFQHWKAHIKIFAEDENSKEILYGNINLSNAIELLNKNDQYSEETHMKIDQTTPSNEDTIIAKNIYKKRNRRLFNALVKSISTEIYNKIDVDPEANNASALFQDICKFFEPKEDIAALYTDFINRTFAYGEDANSFYRDLKKLFTKLQNEGLITDEKVLKYRALQALPTDLKTMKRHYFDNSDDLSYNDMIKKIVEDYDKQIKLEPPNNNNLINQVTQTNHANATTPEHELNQTTELLNRIDIKSCSYCLNNNYKAPHTHTQNECGHLNPELKNKHMNKRQPNTFEKHRPTNNPHTSPNYKSQSSSENYKPLLTGHLSSDVALFDQGSDVTYTCRLDLLTNIKQLNTPVRFSTINGDAKSSLVGTMHLNLGYRNGTINWIEKEAYYSPHYTSTILSKNLLKKHNLYLFYKPPYRATFHNSRNEELVHDVPLTNEKLLFKLNVNPIHNVPKYIFSVSRMKKTSLTQWHTRIAHLHEQATRNLLKRLYNITFPRNQRINCDSCKMNKTNQPSFDGKLNKAKGPLDILHSDLMNIPTNTDEKYVLVIIDEYTRYAWTFPIKYKSEIFDNITNLHKEIERQTGHKVKRMHSDRAKEYMSDRLHKYYQTHGIRYEYTAGYAPPSNGIAERYNQTIQRGIATLLTDAKLPNEYWMFAMNYYTYIKNCSPHSSIATTPIEELFDTLPPLHRLQAFGCRAYVQHPTINSNKVSPIRFPGIFLGFDKNSNGAIIQINDDILISRNVHYNEYEFPGITNLNTIYSANHSFAYRSPLSFSHDDNNQTDSSDEENEEEESSSERTPLPQDEPNTRIQEIEPISQGDTDIQDQEDPSQETSFASQGDTDTQNQEESSQEPTFVSQGDTDLQNQEEPTHKIPHIVQHDTDMEEQVEIPQEETSHIPQNDLDKRAQEEPTNEIYPTSNDTPMQAQEELPKEISYTPQNGTDPQEQEEFPKATSYASDNNVEKQEQAKSPYIQSPISHYNHEPHTEKQVDQMSPNTNTDDPPVPTPVRTIYDRFDKQEESPNEYLGFNHSSKRKAPPTRVKGTPIQPGQARHAARVIKEQEDNRLSKAEDAKTDIHYDRLKEQWSQFDDDKKRIYPDPELLLHKAINKLIHVDHTLATKAEPNKKIRHAYALAKLQPTNDIPTTYKQAITHPDAIKWRHGMEEEMATHDRNNTWTLIDLKDVPRDTNIVGSRWVFNIKTNAENEPIKWKARLVAQGFSQKPGIDYEETYAPVTSLRIIRLLIAIAVEENLQIHQMDVTGAYLYGNIDQPIYMKLPPGTYENEKNKKICKLNKALYGLKQSGRIWYEVLNKILQQMGFKSSYSEPSYTQDTSPKP
ncbi:hypothetical protein E3Q20_04416 [Wallemia mellicola]|nr:hypothetical protein E3Q20_04416 [Wallemia mellicola]